MGFTVYLSHVKHRASEAIRWLGSAVLRDQGCRSGTRPPEATGSPGKPSAKASALQRSNGSATWPINLIVTSALSGRSSPGTESASGSEQRTDGV